MADHASSHGRSGGQATADDLSLGNGDMNRLTTMGLIRHQRLAANAETRQWEMGAIGKLRDMRGFPIAPLPASEETRYAEDWTAFGMPPESRLWRAAGDSGRGGIVLDREGTPHASEDAPLIRQAAVA